jgi:hypothetical protein
VFLLQGGLQGQLYRAFPNRFLGTDTLNLPQVIIFSNMLDSLKVILEAMETYDLTFDKPENEVCSRKRNPMELTNKPHVGLRRADDYGARTEPRRSFPEGVSRCVPESVER